MPTMSERKTALRKKIAEANGQLANWTQIIVGAQAQLQLLDELEPEQPEPAHPERVLRSQPNGEDRAGY